MTDAELSVVRNRARGAQVDAAIESHAEDSVIYAHLTSGSQLEFLEKGPVDVLNLIAEIDRLRSRCQLLETHTGRFETVLQERDRFESGVRRLESEHATARAERDRAAGERDALRRIQDVANARLERGVRRQ